jgi:2-hydroxycyclohexanecarboxyl-CoA dehydrogenase
MSERQERVAVVTGAAQGIGEATARRLAGQGFHAVIVDVNPAGAAVARSIADNGGAATFFQCDLTVPDQIDALGRMIADRFGGLDVLINNAGWTPHERFLEQNPAVWQRIVAINYLAVLHCCRVLVPLMPDGAARLGVGREAVYAGAKAAVIGFSKSLAVELASRRIRVNVVAPSTTLTPLVRNMFDEEQIARRVRATPLGRLAEPDDIAEVIAYFATGAPYVTGQVLSVNGGSARPG